MNPAETPISLGADHGGEALKNHLAALLKAAGHAVTDHGTHGQASVDYPDFAHLVCADVEAGRARFGILVCGSGIGMCISANRHAGIRAAVLHHSTDARLTRAHNNANVACFGARLTGPELAEEALRVFLATAYEGGRHDRRIDKITPKA